jgi:hypothetical protein
MLGNPHKIGSKEEEEEVYLFVLYDSQNKQQLFPWTALINWSLVMDTVCFL